MTITRVAILGDVLRPHPSAAARSEAVTRTLWLRDLLAPPVSRATGLPVTTVTADGAPIDYQALYRAAGLEPSPDAWASLYAADLPAAVEAPIVAACRDALVIGMELPPSIARALARADIPALDCFVHPWRFLHDIPLAWRSTVAAIGTAVAAFAVDQYEVERQIGRIRAKMRWIGAPPLVPGTTLILDQLPEDAAMIDPRSGRRVSWSDYRDALQAMRDAGPVIWRPHPYAGPASALAECFGPEAMTDANFYALLSSDALESVVAISSGGVAEARAFGKRGIHLLDRDHDRAWVGWTPAVPVLGHWLSPHFWSAVLAPVVSTSSAVPVIEPEPHAFRRANNTDWDYGWIDRIVQRDAARATRDRETAHRLDTVQERAEVIAAGVHTLDERTTHAAQQVAALSRQLADAQAQLARLVAADRSRVRAVIDRLLTSARANGWRLGVLGGGQHTRFLLDETALGTEASLQIFDRDPAAVGRRFGSFTVRSAEEIPGAGLDAILVSSLAYEDDMVGDLQSLGVPADRIVRCYR